MSEPAWRGPASQEMALLGVVRTVRQRDGAALALALSCQTALIGRSGT
ncbi:hypothetical protein [Nonomuraea sp. NPDC048916]